MIKVDLITGFLGSGKTTFLKKYVAKLISEGEKVGILENDYGAVNVDMMLLQDLRGERCELEMVAGGCDQDCHIRRFKTKLIAMAMSGYTRVVVEPSGLFDIDEFFDVLRDEPLDRFYDIGSVIAIVDAGLEDDLSDYSGFMLASQVASAGRIVLSKTTLYDEERIEQTLALLRAHMDKYQIRRAVKAGLISKDWDEFDDDDWRKIKNASYIGGSFIKAYSMNDAGYETLYYMNFKANKEDLISTINKIFTTPSLGNAFRIKGFIPLNEDWLQINATKKKIEISLVPKGQEVIIIIGENLNKDEIDKFFPGSVHV